MAVESDVVGGAKVAESVLTAVVELKPVGGCVGGMGW